MSISNRRQFLREVTGAAGIALGGSRLISWASPAPQSAPSAAPRKRREISIGGRRVRVIDLHCHVHIPEAWELIKDYELGQFLRKQLDARPSAPARVSERLAYMDEQGIDMEAVGINPFWYGVERDLARELIKVQNEQIAKMCAANPDRFVGLASVALQYPYMAAEQLQDGMKRLGLRGAFLGGSVEGAEIASQRFDPFWAKAEELGAVVFIHPQEFRLAESRFQGNGNFEPVVGDPIETTIALSHLIFEGTLDRFPRLKIVAAHGGGYLPSYIGRSDRCVENHGCKPLKKKPSEYLRQLYVDHIVFTNEGLRHLVAECGASQIVLGTDFPYGMGSAHPVDDVLNATSLTDADRIAILGENAAKLLRLDS